MEKIKLKKICLFVFGVFLLTFLQGCSTNFLSYAQQISSPDGEYNYGLYFDSVGIGDPGFYVLKLEKNIDPKKFMIKLDFREGVSEEDSDLLSSKQILYNYDEAGRFTSNPKIELLENRFLVFSRGGYYFGLYDVKLDKAIINVGSPWHERIAKDKVDLYKKFNQGEEEIEYGKRIQKNLDEKIKEYIMTNK